MNISLCVVMSFLRDLDRNTASCTHVSGLMHALVVMSPPEVGTTQGGCEDLPVTSFTCQCNVPQKQKESSANLSIEFISKTFYGCERKK